MYGTGRIIGSTMGKAQAGSQAQAVGSGMGITGNTGNGFWQGAGGTATAQGASGILGGAMGMMTRNWYDKRQLRQQKKLNALGMQTGKAMADYEQQLAKEMWEFTGPENQRKQLEKAGLNVGLMYGGGGAGGSTQGAGTADSVNSGFAPAGGGELGLGMQLGLANLATAAQIKLTEAQTKKVEAETPNQPIIGENIGVDTEKKRQEIQNLKTVNAINQHIEAKERVFARITEMTESDVINFVKAQGVEMANKANISTIDYNVKDATEQTQINQIRENLQKTRIESAFLKSGIAKNNQEIKNMEKGIDLINHQITDMIAKRGIEWAKIDQKEQERFLQKAFLDVQKEYVEFQTSTPAQLKQWTDLLGSFMNAAPNPVPNRIGF